jgi:hypothetical protein
MDLTGSFQTCIFEKASEESVDKLFVLRVVLDFIWLRVLLLGVGVSTIIIPPVYVMIGFTSFA